MKRKIRATALVLGLAFVLSACGREGTIPGEIVGQRWILLDANDNNCSAISGAPIKKVGDALTIYDPDPLKQGKTCAGDAFGTISIENGQQNSITVTLPMGERTFTVQPYLFLGNTPAMMVIVSEG